MKATYPHAPGYKVEGTSREAAESMVGRAKTLEALCFTALIKAPHTADEVAEILHESPFSIRPRFSSLKEKGMITETGERRKNASGKSANVYVAAGRYRQGDLL
jgi:predicted transcriptional regulator